MSPYPLSSRRRVRSIFAIVIGLALGLAFVSPSSAVVGTPWSAGAGRWPTVVVSNTGAVAAWVAKSSAASPYNRVVVCVMKAGGSTCAHKTTLSYTWGPTPQILGNTRPAVSVFGPNVRVAVAGSVFVTGLGVAVWTSSDGGITFAGPHEAGIIQENLGGLVFNNCGFCSPRLYAWSQNYAGGAMVSVLDPAGNATLGSVVVDATARYSTPGGGLVVAPNGDLFLVAETSTEVRVYRALAFTDELNPANWTRVLTASGEELGNLWTEGLFTNLTSHPGQYLSLVTNRASDGAPRVRRWTGSAFTSVLTVPSGSGYKHAVTAAVDGTGRTWVFNTSPDSTSLIVARPVKTSVGAFTRIVPYSSTGFNIGDQAASLTGNGYGLYAYVVNNGGGNFTQRFVALKVPHSVSVKAAASATVHRYTLTVTIPPSEVPGAKMTIKVISAGKTTTLKSAFPANVVYKLTVRPTKKGTVYQVSVGAGGWWTARTATLTLNPR
jgi:hypothetical protein